MSRKPKRLANDHDLDEALYRDGVHERCIRNGRSAHYVAPNRSMAGATEKYTLRVPREGKAATVSAELEIPEGVIVGSRGSASSWKYDTKRTDDRIVAITGTMNIPPGEFAEFSFVARNPRDQKEMVWPVNA